FVEAGSVHNFMAIVAVIVAQILVPRMGVQGRALVSPLPGTIGSGIDLPKSRRLRIGRRGDGRPGLQAFIHASLRADHLGLRIAVLKSAPIPAPPELVAVA